jgi:hypothetical protein
VTLQTTPVDIRQVANLNYFFTAHTQFYTPFRFVQQIVLLLQI